MPQGIGYPTGQFGYTNPNQPPPQVSGGDWKWDFAKGAWDFIKNNAGDILTTGAGIVEGYMSSEDRARERAERARQYDEGLRQRQSEFDRDYAERQAAREQSGGQFDRTTGNAEAQAAVRAQTMLNAAPMADNAQALLMGRMGVSPGVFQPRDYTQGADQLKRIPQAPGASVATTMQRNAANYKPGDGGVDTSTIKMLLDKMRGSSGMTPPTPPPPTTPPVVRDNPEGPAPNEPRRRFPAMRGPSLPQTDDDPTAILRHRMGLRT